MTKRYYYNDNTEWALYKGEELLAMGTAKQIAKQLGISVRSVLHYQTQSYLNEISKHKGPNKSRILISLTADEVLSPDDGYKWCTRCEDHYLKNSDNFYVDKNVKGGYSCYCQECAKAYQREYYSRKKEEKRALDKE